MDKILIINDKKVKKELTEEEFKEFSKELYQYRNSGGGVSIQQIFNNLSLIFSSHRTHLLVGFLTFLPDHHKPLFQSLLSSSS